MKQCCAFEKCGLFSIVARNGIAEPLWPRHLFWTNTHLPLLAPEFLTAAVWGTHAARMLFYAVKLLVSAGLIVLISEISKRSGFIGGLIASLPLVSLLAIGWIWFETHDNAKIADFSRSVFWFVLPSLLFFLLLPWLLPKLGFYTALAIACVATAAGYAVMAATLQRAGINI